MDRQEVQAAYCRAAAEEREKEMYRLAVRKSAPVTRGMTAQERERFLSGQTFAATLYQTKRRDRAYQTLQRGELAVEEYQAEFEALLPMLESELDGGFAIDLPFLRSVERAGVSLDRARRAAELMRRQAPRDFFRQSAPRLSENAEKRAERFLQKGDLRFLVKRDQAGDSILSQLMSAVFSKGVPADVVRAA